MKKVAALALAAWVWALPCIAIAQDNRISPTININISPENKRRGEAYETAASNLTGPQKQQLAKLIDADRLSGLEPFLELQTAKRILVRCLESRQPAEKEALRRQAALLNHYLGSQYHRNSVLLDQKAKALDFIDAGILRGKIAAENDMTLQLFTGMAALYAQTASPEEACSKFSEDYRAGFAAVDGKTSPATPADPATVQSAAMREQASGAPYNCTFSWRGSAEDGRQVTGVTVFGADRPPDSLHDVSLTFSLRLHGTDGKPVKIGKGWIDYGGVDTRRVAYYMNENTEITMGSAHPGSVVSMIGRMAAAPLRFAVTEAATGKHYSFAIDDVPAARLRDFAGCAATLLPETAANLREAGIPFAIDPAHAAALKKPPGPAAVYKTMALSGNPDDPWGCALQSPFVRQGDSEYGATLIIYGPKSRSRTLKNITHIWVMGSRGKKGERISFTDARAAVPATDGTTAWDSRAVEAGRLSGERYEIHLPLREGGRLFDILQRQGGMVEATAKGFNTPLKIPLPRIGPEDANQYGNCLKNMMRQKPAAP